jgi:hypothetical protein
MKPHIRKPTDTELRKVLDRINNTEERGVVAVLLQRYGARRVADLLPEQVTPFTAELVAILTGAAPHPADSTLDPAIMEVCK